jgi:hypothetical protein
MVSFSWGLVEDDISFFADGTRKAQDEVTVVCAKTDHRMYIGSTLIEPLVVPALNFISF